MTTPPRTPNQWFPLMHTTFNLTYRTNTVTHCPTRQHRTPATHKQHKPYIRPNSTQHSTMILTIKLYSEEIMDVEGTEPSPRAGVATGDGKADEDGAMAWKLRARGKGRNARTRARPREPLPGTWTSRSHRRPARSVERGERGKAAAFGRLGGVVKPESKLS